MQGSPQLSIASKKKQTLRALAQWEAQGCAVALRVTKY
jgi:hypothetical protein